MGARSKLTVTLLTGRSIEQGVSKEHGKASKDYMESVSVCYIDADDLRQLGTKDKTNVQVTTDHGSVVVTALKSPRGFHRGMIFIPYGPWANVVVNAETDSLGMPSYKGIPALIESAPKKAVLELRELLKVQFGKE
jgi:formylmethanofuran dehydrogenase subunit D